MVALVAAPGAECEPFDEVFRQHHLKRPGRDHQRFLPASIELSIAVGVFPSCGHLSTEAFRARMVRVHAVHITETLSWIPSQTPL
jgi:hypothetical protein